MTPKLWSRRSPGRASQDVPATLTTACPEAPIAKAGPASGATTTVGRAVQTLASHALRLALAAVTGVVIARALQPESRGVYAVIATTAGIAVLAGQFSLEKSQIALWPDASRQRALIGNGLILGLLLGLVAAASTLTFMTVFAPLPEPHLLIIALVAVPFCVAWSNLQSILLLQSRIRPVNRASVMTGLCQCLPILLLAAAGTLNVTAVIVCWTISTVLPFVLFVHALGRSTIRGNMTLARRQLVLSGRYYLHPVAFHLLLTVDVLLLNALASPAEVGVYTVAVTVLYLAQVPAEAVTQICLPRQTVESNRDAEVATCRTIRLNLLLSAIVVGGLVITAPVLIPLVYGSAYGGSVAPLFARAPGSLALVLLRPIEQYLVRLERPLTMTAIPVGALAVNLVLNILLIPRLGAVGAGLAWSVAYLTVAGVEVLWFARVSGVPPRELLPRLSDLDPVLSRLRCRGRSHSVGEPNVDKG
ncbi:lipopolysaccharide biosynthesis protein [Nonomuraea sp. 3N208]|uniref:lipopolysaccharide biosynthesis protein n=1 Tax=Nonomuraea sp. 3N208 TaxID=3457421 RepID=UPI003FD6BD67